MKNMKYTNKIRLFLGLFCMFALTVGMTTPSLVVAAAVDVTTLAPIAYQKFGVTLNGYIYAGDLNVSAKGSYIYTWFEWGKTTGSTFNHTTNSKSLTVQLDNAPFSANLTKLSAGTYYYRTVAVHQNVFSYGGVVSFTVQIDGDITSGGYYTSTGGVSYLAPTVATYLATNVSGTSANLNGSIDPRGRTDVARWFQWGTSTSLGYTTPQTYNASYATGFSQPINGLKPNTTYYYRAVAQNPGSGTVYGATLSFITTGGAAVSTQTTIIPAVTAVAPVASTKNATLVGKTIATLKGSAFSGGDNARGWFEWGKTTSLGNNTPSQTIRHDAAVNFSQPISGLSSGTTYYYRAVVETSTNKDIGGIVSFATQSVESQQTTGSVSQIPPAQIEYGPVETIATSSLSQEATTTNTQAALVSTGKSDITVIKDVSSANVARGGFFPNSLIEWAIMVVFLLAAISFTNYLYISRQRMKRALEEEQKDRNMNNKASGGVNFLRK